MSTTSFAESRKALRVLLASYKGFQKIDSLLADADRAEESIASLGSRKEALESEVAALEKTVIKCRDETATEVEKIKASYRTQEASLTSGLDAIQREIDTSKEYLSTLESSVKAARNDHEVALATMSVERAKVQEALDALKVELAEVLSRYSG